MPFKKRKREDVDSGNSSVPYREADPDLGEIPLDDIDTFVIPSRDDKGAQAHVQFSMPPYMFRQIQVIVNSRRFPYLDVPDFIRHAIARHLVFCVSIRHSIPKHIVPSMEAIMEVCRDSELRLKVTAAYEEIDRQITNYLNRLEIPEAIRLMTILKNRIDEVAPSPRQKQVRAEILRRYGFVLEHDGTVRPGKLAELEAGDMEDEPVRDKKTGRGEGKSGGFQ